MFATEVEEHQIPAFPEDERRNRVRGNTYRTPEHDMTRVERGGQHWNGEDMMVVPWPERELALHTLSLGGNGKEWRGVFGDGEKRERRTLGGFYRRGWSSREGVTQGDSALGAWRGMSKAMAR